MKLVNLTPHAIHLMDDEKNILETIHPSGTLARVSVEDKQIMPKGLIAPVPVVSREFGEVEGLPEPEKETLLIVSMIVAQAAGDLRSDLVSPGHLVRDEQGRVIGCTTLVGNKQWVPM